MKTYHTPAPWTHQPGKEERIAPDVVFVGDIGDIPNPADAALIAAAPDLLACLQRLVNLSTHPYFPPISDIPAWQTTIAAARAALYKANPAGA